MSVDHSAGDPSRGHRPTVRRHICSDEELDELFAGARGERTDSRIPRGCVTRWSWLSAT